MQIILPWTEEDRAFFHALTLPNQINTFRTVKQIIKALEHRVSSILARRYGSMVAARILVSSSYVISWGIWIIGIHLGHPEWYIFEPFNMLLTVPFYETWLHRKELFRLPRRVFDFAKGRWVSIFKAVAPTDAAAETFSSQLFATDELVLPHWWQEYNAALDRYFPEISNSPGVRRAVSRPTPLDPPAPLATLVERNYPLAVIAPSRPSFPSLQAEIQAADLALITGPTPTTPEGLAAQDAAVSRQGNLLQERIRVNGEARRIVEEARIALARRAAQTLPDAPERISWGERLMRWMESYNNRIYDANKAKAKAAILAPETGDSMAELLRWRFWRRFFREGRVAVEQARLPVDPHAWDLTGTLGELLSNTGNAIVEGYGEVALSLSDSISSLPAETLSTLRAVRRVRWLRLGLTINEWAQPILVPISVVEALSEPRPFTPPPHGWFGDDANRRVLDGNNWRSKTRGELLWEMREQAEWLLDLPFRGLGKVSHEAHIPQFAHWLATAPHNPGWNRDQRPVDAIDFRRMDRAAENERFHNRLDVEMLVWPRIDEARRLHDAGLPIPLELEPYLHQNLIEGPYGPVPNPNFVSRRSAPAVFEAVIISFVAAAALGEEVLGNALDSATQQNLQASQAATAEWLIRWRQHLETMQHAQADDNRNLPPPQPAPHGPPEVNLPLGTHHHQHHAPPRSGPKRF